MLKKYSSWAINQPSPSMKTDLTTMKLITVKGDGHDQFKNRGKVDSSPHMYMNIDESSQLSTRIHTPAMQPVVISKQNASYFAASVDIPPPSIDEQNKVQPIHKSSKGTSTTGIAQSTPKRNHKHKHHHHHGKRHYYHHHIRQRQSKNVEQQQQQTIRAPANMAVTNSKYINQGQQPVIIYREAPSNKDYKVDPNTLASVPHGTDNENVLIDDQQTPLVVYRDANVRQSIATDSITQSVLLNQNQETKTSKGNIPLRSFENKLVSQRATPVKDRQVSNYPPMIFTPSYTNTYGVPEFEQIYYEDNCCVPSSTIGCASNSCIFQQSDPCVCLPQQEQILVCTDPTSSQDCICSTSNSNFIQQTSFPQQQYICVDQTPSTTIQPTIINEIPVFNPISTNRSSQCFICLPQTSPQPLQIIQPQIVQTQPMIQIPTQAVAASPQILYQRPYDSIVSPVQNRQYGGTNTSFIALSQPSYAPAQKVSPGPHMFRQALLRSFANQTGAPVPLSASGGSQFVQSPIFGSSGGAPLASTARGPVNPFDAVNCSIM